MASDGPPGAGVHAVDLYWIPLGSGAHVVRLSGRIYEAVAAAIGRRRRCDLYHSALDVRTPSGRHVIEVAPVLPGDPAERGVVAQGAVGSRFIGGIRLFRYEVRCWPDGSIPDAAAAVGGPLRVIDDPDRVVRLLALAPEVPTAVWGRHELARGDMWNSNSVTSWLLARVGVDMTSVRPPPGGRAPGWDAGLAVAARGERPPS